MKINSTKMLALCCFMVFHASCGEKDLYGGYWVDDLNDITKAYIYPYKNEARNVVAEISVETDGTVNLDNVNIAIPHLKYNKSLLFMLTQDDCKQAAFSYTWAAIHNKPLSKRYHYDYVHLTANDLPPDIYFNETTLGSTDGAGNEVRFSFTTTLAPEWEFMDAYSDVAYTTLTNYNRFSLKSGLTWRSVIEMMNYDVGIAFHDVMTNAVSDTDSIKKHYEISQQIMLEKLSGRGCKVLAEPNGNKAYVAAAKQYAPIQAMTAQAGSEIIKPGGEGRDLHGILQERWFIEPDEIRDKINTAFATSEEKREAIHIGVHGTDTKWVKFLLWLNNTYGKNGADNIWMPGFEEYYEYNYNRVNANIEKTIEGNTLKIKITLPGGEYFYFPSTTVNLIGLNKSQIKSVNSGSSITGLSYNDYTANNSSQKNLMINIDCRHSLVEHAEHYTKEHEENKSDESLKADAIYFINRLKDSEQKTALLKRVQ